MLAHLKSGKGPQRLFKEDTCNPRFVLLGGLKWTATEERRGRLCEVPKLKGSAEVQKLRRQSFQMSKIVEFPAKESEKCEKLWAWTVQRTAWLFPLKGAWWTKSRWVDTWSHWRDHWTGDQHPGVPEREEDGGLGHLRHWLWPRPEVTKILGEVS